MALHLLIDGARAWKLPGDADAQQLTSDIARAARQGDVMLIDVELGDDPREQIRLVLNTKTMTSAAVIDTPPSEPTEPFVIT